MKFVQKYNYYKRLYSIINEGNIDSLTNNIQYELIGDKSYKDLTPEEQKQLNVDIKNKKLEISDKVNQITTNTQYQSWIYDILKNKDQDIFEDFNDIKNTINQFIEIKNSSKISKENKDIQNYKSFSDLHKFVYDFINANKKHESVIFPLLYSNNSYNLYKIDRSNKDQFQQIYGVDGFKTAWCVTSKDSNYFEKYLTGVNDYYILWLTKDNKPFALLHFNSNQFKNVHDKSMNDFSTDVLDGLSHCNINMENLKGDLLPYKIELIRYNNPNISDTELFIQMYSPKAKLNKNSNIDYNGDINNDILKLFIKDGELTIQFNSVTGSFDCSRNDLTSLAGCPQTVGGGFYCSDNQLTSLEGAPQTVGRNFNCSRNDLTSLAGGPQTVGGGFYCSDNQLTSLVGCPQTVGGGFDCSYNQLTSLVGCPQTVGGYFYCSDNQLTSLEGAPQTVGRNFNCSDNQLTSLAGCPQTVGGVFYCNNNQLTSLEGAPKSCKSLDITNNPIELTDQIINTFKYQIIK